MSKTRTAASLAFVLTLAACGGSSDTASTIELSAEAQRGLEITNQAGCAACHGTDGRGGGVGPGWVGLAGSTVTLEDGSQVTADGTYLRTAIVDPTAQVRSGYTIAMPVSNLTDTEVDALVAYIMEMK